MWVVYEIGFVEVLKMVDTGIVADSGETLVMKRRMTDRLCQESSGGYHQHVYYSERCVIRFTYSISNLNIPLPSRLLALPNPNTVDMDYGQSVTVFLCSRKVTCVSPGKCALSAPSKLSTLAADT